MRVEATNHIGWVVEVFAGSWDAVTFPTTRLLADEMLDDLKESNPGNEYRVYEAVKQQAQR